MAGVLATNYTYLSQYFLAKSAIYMQLPFCIIKIDNSFALYVKAVPDPVLI
ncbi:protein of unknown function [Xenorhabdus nematophila AN6/1]|nr:protein of unknown function [Xenorhabdus nematophila AN6/1]